MSDLLPPSSTFLEKRIAQANKINIEINIPAIRQSSACPDAFLPYLAWDFSVDEWDSNWSTDIKREVIAESVLVHVRKGTVYAVRQALKALLGETNFRILEGKDNSGTAYNHWAKYSVRVSVPVSIDFANSVRRTLEMVAPARCTLAALDFKAVQFSYNGRVRYNGIYSYGVA